VRRFDVYLVALDPTRGSEIRKTRLCVVLSPDEMNRHLSTIIIAPMTTRHRGYPSRVVLEFAGKGGEIALDQIRTIDKTRLVRQLGKVDDATARKVTDCLAEMFAYE
jgi:mRNA interferase MazF